MPTITHIPRDLQLDFLANQPSMSIPYSKVNHLLRSISLDTFQKADRTILTIFPTFSQIDPQKIPRDHALLLFMKLVNHLHDEAKHLGCDLVHDKALNPLARMVWECENYETLMQEVKGQMELAKTKDFNTFVTVVAQTVGAQIPEGMDLREFWENNLRNDPGIKQITSLNLFSKGLKFLPPEIGFFTNVRSLFLGSNQINEIPAALASLSKLETLDFSQNQLGEISNLPPSLKHLRLGGNMIKDLPEGLVPLGLLSLDISHNPLGKFPEVIPALSRLQILHLSKVGIDQLPDPLDLPPLLAELYLTDNNLSEISESAMASLSSLRKLYLYKNPLSETSISRLRLHQENNRQKEIRWVQEVPRPVWGE